MPILSAARAPNPTRKEKANSAIKSNSANNANTTNSKEPNRERGGAPLNIVISGAGIGGLCAAVLLRQQGHRVIVLEKSAAATETGAAVHLAPNANGVLRRMGLDAEAVGANRTMRITEYTPSGDLVRTIDVEAASRMWQHPWLLCHRIHLHQELTRIATAPEGKGRAVELRKKSRVVDVETETATVVLENGERVVGDVVSLSRSAIPSCQVRARPSGSCTFRFLVTRQAILDDPRTAKYGQTDGELILQMGRDRRVVMYPCNNNTLMNFVCIHPASCSESGDIGNYNQGGHKNKLLEIYTGWDPSLIALLEKADPDSLKVWELLDMDPLPTWVSGRLCLLGDAAHPFLPHQGQGAGQAIEDAAALAVVLPLGTTAEEVAERLQLYQECRYERATKIQDFSRLAGSVSPEEGLDVIEHTDYNFGHDEWDSATDRFRRWKWAKRPDMYWRQPIAFGPMPGPRQDFEGRPRRAEHSTSVTASMKFKTSRTVLQNLFPTKAFAFKSPGTVAYASFSQTTLDKMDWLGGGGYNHFGLYIHGVQYTKQNGEVVNGTYMPILFESLADPIVSGREELGMPKLYCSLDVHRRVNSYRLRAGWQGASFCDMALEDLEPLDVSEETGTFGGEADDGIMVYRYIPDVGNRGRAVSEHAVFVPHAQESKVVPTRVQQGYRAGKASIAFDAMDWKALPTLHHVVERLAEIPIYEVVGGKVVEAVGVPDINLRPIKRFITGHDPDGKKIFSDKMEEEVPMKALPDSAGFGLCYATKGFTIQIQEDADISTYQSYLGALPGITISNGSVMRVVDMMPGALSPMHRTVSLDYGVVIEGEVMLELGSGEKRVLSSTSWARMLYVLLPTEAIVVGGKTLGETTHTIPGVKASE
ncbi:FAD-binding domain-containing protein [Saccharata proteae CBS 121410]|uniref:FAD-binding domain-containing protein n=1 Tax=Saccharata proteae CBS 121410 TaxID=1314787 RepID=A0A9P4LTI6_9PEZI|nr:FAD-binding domain-containing protein [Saccharata proteae CBS 121410]